MTTIFKVRYSYQAKIGDSPDYVVIPRTVMVSASDPSRARDKVSEYFMANRGSNPGFRIISVSLCPTIYDLIK